PDGRSILPDFCCESWPAAAARSSLRQPCPAQALDILRAILRSKRGNDIVQIRKPKLWIDSTQPRRSLLRLRCAPGQGVARGRDPQRKRVDRMVSQCLLCPFHGFVVAAGAEMSQRGDRLPQVYAGVEWAQPRGTCRMLNRQIRLAEAEP